MRLTLFVVLLLVSAANAENCRDCKPAPHIATCTDLHCYRCGKN